MPSRLPHSLPSDRRTPGPKPKTARSPKNKIVKKDRPPRGAQTAPFGGQSFCDAPARERRSVVPGSAARIPCIAGRGRDVTEKRQPSASPTKGPMQASAPTQRGDTPQPSSTRYACRPLVLPPACLALQGGRSRPPGGPCAGPEVYSQGKLWHLPLQGRLYRWQFSQSLPCKGRWLRRKAQTEGCIAGWRWRYPAKSGRALPRIRRGRCLHRPGKPCGAATPKRRAKTPALQSRRKRAVDKRQPSASPYAGEQRHPAAPTADAAPSGKLQKIDCNY